MSEIGECAREMGAPSMLRDGRAIDAEEMRAPSMLRLIRRGCGLCDDVADLTFELGVKSSAAEAETVLAVAHAPRSCKKSIASAIGKLQTTKDERFRARTIPCRRYHPDVTKVGLDLGVNSMIIQREEREGPPLALGYGPSS